MELGWIKIRPFLTQRRGGRKGAQSCYPVDECFTTYIMTLRVSMIISFKFSCNYAAEKLKKIKKIIKTTINFF
jgi:hypothetical protein